MLNGEDTGGELDRPRVVEWHALSGTNRAALDQVFAQAADDTDTIALDD
jgi:hypothetical protein